MVFGGTNFLKHGHEDFLHSTYTWTSPRLSFAMTSNEVDIAYDIVLSLLSFSVIVLVIILILQCKKTPEKLEEILPTKTSACRYSLTEIDAATNGFSSRRIIGKGRLGTVYTALMARGDSVVVKRIHPRLVLSNAGNFMFSSTLKSLSLARHPHIVSILGYSEAPGERIIVSEFISLMSLEHYLQKNSDVLDWRNRTKIAAGVARGLEYLHEVMVPPIVHGCVKSPNILIDLKFVAKICDYGLSFLAPQVKEVVVGYVDDEFWVNKNGASKESDVYGLGVVLLEILSGRRSEKGFNIVEWALPLIKGMKINQVLDQRLVIPYDVKPLVRLAKVGAACVGNSRKNRPSIVQVVAILNNLESGAMVLSL